MVRTGLSQPGGWVSSVPRRVLRVIRNRVENIFQTRASGRINGGIEAAPTQPVLSPSATLQDTKCDQLNQFRRSHLASWRRALLVAPAGG